MPPGQPVLRCQDCELLRPCKRWSDGWLCVDCSPVTVSSETDSEAVITDGRQYDGR